MSDIEPIRPLYFRQGWSMGGMARELGHPRPCLLGEGQARGITRQGSRFLRWALVEAAIDAVRPSGPLEGLPPAPAAGRGRPAGQGGSGKEAGHGRVLDARGRPHLRGGGALPGSQGAGELGSLHGLSIGRSLDAPACLAYETYCHRGRSGGGRPQKGVAP